MALFGVFNYSGNLGKTVVAEHLLRQNIQRVTGIACDLIGFETINSGGQYYDRQYAGHEFLEASKQEILFNEAENKVIDVGSSNIEPVGQMMKKLVGSAEDYSNIVVPSVADTKQQFDTAKTLEFLIKTLGVDPTVIRLVFNRIPDTWGEKAITATFRDLLLVSKQLGVTHEIAVLHENPIYDHIKSINCTLWELADHRVEYTKLQRIARLDEDRAEVERLGMLVHLARMASSAVIDLEQAFYVMFPEHKQ